MSLLHWNLFVTPSRNLDQCPEPQPAADLSWVGVSIPSIFRSHSVAIYPLHHRCCDLPDTLFRGEVNPSRLEC